MPVYLAKRGWTRVRIALSASDMFWAQRGHWFHWCPIALACGIGGYFAIRIEPPIYIYSYILVGVLIFFAVALWRNGPLRVMCSGVALILMGFLIAGARGHYVKAPVLGWRYYGAVEGRIIAIDRSSSNAVRLTLDQVFIPRFSTPRIPKRVRVSLHGDQRGYEPEPYQKIMLEAHLLPPSGPAEPHGFDFRRYVWFQKIGAVGYTRKPVKLRAPPDRHVSLFQARMALGEHLRSTVSKQSGAVLAAITTGDRSYIAPETTEALRQTNLAHLLAISGLHMGLVSGFVFLTIRLMGALIPFIALRWPVRKIAAVCAIVASAGYLALSGGNVATERAFVMVGVMFTAILFDRRAISLRAVALAALIVLLLQPETLVGPGFQMSFAATTALIAVFSMIRDYDVSLGPKWLQPLSAMALSSLVAGLATAPFAAAHFNQIAHFGFIANLLSVPVMGLIVMPFAVVGFALMPLGLDAPAFWVSDIGLRWILGVAETVAAWDGAVGYVPMPPVQVLPLIACGGLFVMLWQGGVRWAGSVPLCIAVFLWGAVDRPIVLISEHADLLGVLTKSGRALSKEKGSNFVADIWQENDGLRISRLSASGLWDGLHHIPIRHVRGKRAAQELDCKPHDWVVVTVTKPPPVPCIVITPKTLQSTGAVAMMAVDRDKWTIITARDITGDRLWTRYRNDTAQINLTGAHIARLNPSAPITWVGWRGPKY